MRRCRAPLAVVTIVLMSLLAAGPASAGGPTSVLLVLPGTGQTASLYTGDADYEALAGLVGAFGESGAAGTVDTSGADHQVGLGVTLTWLMHDVQVWRVDRVFVGADGGPWISTQSVADGSGNIWDSPVAWHSAARGKELSALLFRLGVSPGSRAGGSGAVAGDGAGADAGTDLAAPAAAAGSKQSTGQETDPASPSTGGPVWALAGLALGVALTMVGTRLLPGSRTATGEGSWLLTDELPSPSQQT